MLNFFRSEPFSLQEIRQSLDDPETKRLHFMSVLQKHHAFIKESVPILIDQLAPFDEKQEELKRVFQLLAMHAKAEEDTLYQGLMHSPFKDAHLAAMEGREEHEMITHLVREIEALNYDTIWTEEADAKAMVLGHVLENHIKQEETNMFGTAKRDIDPSILKALGEGYLELCRHALDLELTSDKITGVQVEKENRRWYTDLR